MHNYQGEDDLTKLSKDLDVWGDRKITLSEFCNLLKNTETFEKNMQRCKFPQERFIWEWFITFRRWHDVKYLSDTDDYVVLHRKEYDKLINQINHSPETY